MTEAVTREFPPGEATRGPLDPFLLLSALVLVASTAAHLAGRLPWSYWNAVFLGLAVVAFQWRLRREGRKVFPAAERRFWNMLTVSFACWFLAAVSYSRSTLVNVLQDVLIVFFYVALVVGAELRPDRARRGSVIDPARRFDLAGMVLFAFGLLAYFSIVPGILDPERYDTWIPSTYIYMVLDLYVVRQFFLLSRRSQRRRWRVTYLLLAAGMANWFVCDTLDCISYYPSAPIDTSRPSFVNVFWVTPFVFFLVAARLRDLWPVVGASAVNFRPWTVPTDQATPGLGPLIVYALAFPFLHLLLNVLDLLDPDLQGTRDAVTLVYLGLAILLSLRNRVVMHHHYSFVESERQFLEQEVRHREKMVTLGQVAAGVAHEVGNPLNSIAALAQNLRRKAEDPRMVRKLEQIAVQVERISVILGQMRDLSRPPRRDWDYCPLAELIQSTVELVRFDRRAEAVEIDVELDTAVPAVYGIADQLSQVFLNLALNALDALTLAGGGAPRLDVRSRLLDRDGQATVEIVFEDNGPGIPEEILQRVFEPSFTTKPAGGASGMGLGLTVSRRIVEEHGGSIRAEPVEKGARLVVELPVERPETG